MDRIEKEKEFHNRRFDEETRHSLDKFYTIAKTTSDLYNSKIFKDCRNKTVLEYGCGLGSSAFKLAEEGATVYGIDISEVAIKKANELAKERGLADKVTFIVMNAEHLEFPDNFFDTVCGSAILHHLDLQKATNELKRVLKKGGRGIFLEPLGHNILINLFRKLTPKLRTEDEHPFKKEEIEILKSHFSNCNLSFFHLTTFISLPLRNNRLFNPTLHFFTSLDNILFRIDLFKFQAWQVVIDLIK